MTQNQSNADKTLVLLLNYDHSTVTLFAKFLGWSTSEPFKTATWYASSCKGTVYARGETKSSTYGMFIILQFYYEPDYWPHKYRKMYTKPMYIA